MHKLLLSVVIITKNEEESIAQCINSVSFANEIIVVDSYSTDATCALAKDLGACVVQHNFEGYGNQKNYGASIATHNWILFLDADEQVSPELQNSITKIIANSNSFPIYWITIIDTFLGKQLRHLVGHNPRLIQKNKAYWNTAYVHERMTYSDKNSLSVYKDDKSGVINDPIIHMSYTSISAYLDKMHTYTTLDAEEMRKNKAHRSGRAITQTVFLPYFLAMRQFIKLLIYRGGILDSWQGVVWCILCACYEFEMGKKYLLHGHARPDRASTQIDDVDSRFRGNDNDLLL